MTELALSTAWTFHGLKTILLKNRYLRLTILPEAGGKIWQITYRPLDEPLLWNNPRVPPGRQPIHARYDDVWSGGWDELFPNDEAGMGLEDMLPDHGELWTGEWEAFPFQDDTQVGLRLVFVTPISAFRVERTVVLRRDEAHFTVHYCFTNEGASSFPFLWKLHPAFAVSAGHRIDFPPMTVVREPAFAGSLAEAPLSFKWPHAEQGTGSVDLRQIPDTSSRAVHFFYGTEMQGGWCGITNRANKLAAALRFDPKVFTSCWLFATHGGWRNLNVAVLEPATGYPFRYQEMIAARRARELKPGESLQTDILFAVRQGLNSIGGVASDGTILPGEEA
jgi:hypothetical protein